MMKLCMVLALCLLISTTAGDNLQGKFLLNSLEALMQRAQHTRADDTTSCSTASSGRDPALTMTLAQSTLDDINDFLANSLGAPFDLLGIKVPELDPLTVKKFDIDTQDPDLGKVVIKVNGINITGLSSIEVKSVKLNILDPPLNFQIKLSAGYVHVKSSDYYINCTIANSFSFYGNGVMWFEADGIELYADLDLNGFSLSAIHINDLRLSIAKFQSYFQNLMGGGETGSLVNDVLDTIVPNLAQGLADTLKNMVNNGGLAGSSTTTTAASSSSTAVAYASSSIHSTYTKQTFQKLEATRQYGHLRINV